MTSQALLVLAQPARIDVGDGLLLRRPEAVGLRVRHAAAVRNLVRPRQEAVDDGGVVEVAGERQLLEEPLDVAQRREAALAGADDDGVDAAGGLGAPGGVAEQPVLAAMFSST